MSDPFPAVMSAIRAHDIRFIRFVWTDNAGLIRAKALHVSALPAALEYAGVGNAMAQQALPAMYDSVTPGSGLSPAGEVVMRADWSTLTPLPYAPGHARVLTNMMDGDDPWTLCPRTFLRRMIERAATHGLSLKGAFENEFYLLRPDGAGGGQPVDTSVYAETSSLDGMAPVLNDISAALEAQGVLPEQLHAESGPGQFELPVRYAGALHAADQQVVFKETVRAVAQRHGLIASFLPKIFEQQGGSGAHLHFSLWEGDRNVVAAGEQPRALSQRAGAFVAGVLHHLPALMALTTPTPNSYKRIRPHVWSGAFACWGHGNREAAVRVPVPARPHDALAHLELKTVDPSSNPYLALGAVIAAGIDGIARGLPLGQPVQGDPGDLSETERQSRGILALPSRLDQSIAALEGDTVLLDALGPELARSFLAVRRAEWEALKDMPHEEEIRLLLQRY